MFRNRRAGRKINKSSSGREENVSVLSEKLERAFTLCSTGRKEGRSMPIINRADINQISFFAFL
ncbi:MAG TPA: hypothetical protein VJB06_04420 [archaeon]|nr:hypothetical protein [archaeon]